MNKRQKLSLITLFILPIFGFLLNWIKLGSGCLHALDFGIYQQAIMDLAFTSSWNPLNSVRGIPIFADHFDPILFLAALIQKFLGSYPWVPLIVEFGFYYSGGIVAFLLTRQKPFAMRLMLTALWFFCSGMAVAFRYPIHPTTWSALPLLLLANELKANRFVRILLLLNILCLFKEYYPICFVSFGVYLLLRIRLKHSLIVLANGCLWIWVDFVLRPRLLPDFHGHGNALLSELLVHPGTMLLNSFLKYDWLGSVIALFPLLLALPLYWRHEKNKEWWWSFTAFMTPVFGIQFLFGNIGFQYGAPISAFFLSILIVSRSEWCFSKDLLTIWVRRIMLVSAIWLTGDYLLSVGNVFIPKENHCRFSVEKWNEFGNMAIRIKDEPKESRILATGGLVPVLMMPDRQIYQYGIWSKIQESYDLIAIGRNNTSDLYPFGADYFEKVILFCKPMAKEVLLDTPNLFLARGNFTEDCLHQRHSF